MLFPRKPRGLGPSRADSYRWDGHISQSRCNPAPSCPRALQWGGMQSAAGSLERRADKGTSCW